MGIIQSGALIIHGNFADVLPEMPKDFDYETDAKWLEDYQIEKRECIGGTICSCKKIEVHYAPYYGFDKYHTRGCNLLVKIQKHPHLCNLWAYDHLPAVAFSEQAVPADVHVPLYIFSTSRTHRIKVKVTKSTDQLALL